MIVKALRTEVLILDSFQIFIEVQWKLDRMIDSNKQIDFHPDLHKQSFTKLIHFYCY